MQVTAPSLPSVLEPAKQGSQLSASAAPVASEDFPWPHRKHVAPENGPYLPWGHDEQPLESSLLDSPSPQFWQSEDAEALDKNFPSAHVVQNEVPLPSAYLPTTQATQSVLLGEPTDGLLVPIVQLEHVDPSSSLYLPLTHSMQSAIVVEFVLSVDLPALHETQCALAAR